MSRNYLQVKIEQQQFEELFQYRMMVSTSIKGLLVCRVRELNGSSYLLYDISSMQSLRSLYAEKKMDLPAFCQLIYSLERTVRNMKEYLLEVENLLLYPEFIFQEPDTKEIKFVCHPCAYGFANDSTKKLYEFLLTVIDHDDEELTEIVYQVFERVEEGDGVSWIEGLYKKLNEVLDSRNQEKRQESTEHVASLCPEEMEQNLQDEKISFYPAEEESGVSPARKDGLHPQRCATSLVICLLYAAAVGFGIYYLYANFVLDLKENIITWFALVVVTALLAFWMFLWLKKGKVKTIEPEEKKTETPFNECREVLDENYIEDNSYGKTIYFEVDEIENKLYGIGKKNRRIIRIDKFPFIIGKKEDAVDAVLEEASVSRVHARFYKENSDFATIFLEDLNSTNGTYKNGIMLAPHEKVEVLPEDEIRFGKLQFIYR